MLSGVKEQLLDGDTVRQMAAQIGQQASGPKRDIKGERAELDQQITHVVESLAAVGRSDALTAKLKELEGRRADLERFDESTVEWLVVGAEDHWRALVADLENLRDYAEPHEVEQARVLLQEIIGEIEVREEPGGVFAYTRLNAATGYKDGAQERT